MTKGLSVVCLAVGAFLLLPATGAFACSSEDAQPGAAPERTYTVAVECLVNEQRAAVGLAALGHDRHLARAADRYSTTMVRQQFFAHVSPQGSTLDQRARAAGYIGALLGETLGWGSGSLATPAAIVDGWMNSPPHRAILLDAGFRKIGLGVAAGSPDGMVGAATVTADFGA